VECLGRFVRGSGDPYLELADAAHDIAEHFCGDRLGVSDARALLRGVDAAERMVWQRVPGLSPEGAARGFGALKTAVALWAVPFLRGCPESLAGVEEDASAFAEDLYRLGVTAGR
jgi:hypothetical protein